MSWLSVDLKILQIDRIEGYGNKPMCNLLAVLVSTLRT